MRVHLCVYVWMFGCECENVHVHVRVHACVCVLPYKTYNIFLYFLYVTFQYYEKWMHFILFFFSRVWCIYSIVQIKKMSRQTMKLTVSCLEKTDGQFYVPARCYTA